MDLSSASFECLLNWLHPDREEAGREYQRIRALLIKHFQAHRCLAPNDLADTTIDRVGRILLAGKLPSWVGAAKERYFFRVGYYILLEDKKGKALPEMQIPDGLEVMKPEEDEELELKLHCLEKCLQEQSTANRELVVKYYRGAKAVKIKNREKLAQQMNINLPGLRVRAHRVRQALKECMERCLEQAARSSKSYVYRM
jgi:hypothetical protein